LPSPFIETSLKIDATLRAQNRIIEMDDQRHVETPHLSWSDLPIPAPVRPLACAAQET
jgi:hypothetical protein